MLYRGEDDGNGREFNRYTLLGEYDLFFMALLRERLILDGLDPNDERVLEDQFKAHLCSGVIMLSSRLKGLEDLADLVIAAMEHCMKHLVSGKCSDDLVIFPPVTTAPIEEEEDRPADPPGDHSLAILALMETGTPSDGAAWWTIDALPKLASYHASILIYALKALRLKLSRTQDVLMLEPASLRLQEVRLLLSTLEQVIRNNDDHSAPVWA